MIRTHLLWLPVLNFITIHGERLLAYKRAAQKKYRLRHPDRVKKQCAEWGKKNASRKAEYNRNYRKENAVKIANNGKKYRKENAALIAQRQKRWREKNKSYLTVAKANEYLRNCELRKQQAREWRAKNPAKCAQYRWARRFKTRGDGHGGAEIFRWEKAWRGSSQVKCHWCKCEGPPRNFHADHVMPIALGGKHHITNLVISCQRCNQRKKDKHPDEWIKICIANESALIKST